MKHLNIVILACLFIIGAISCDKDEDPEAVEMPSIYKVEQALTFIPSELANSSLVVYRNTSDEEIILGIKETIGTVPNGLNPTETLQSIAYTLNNQQHNVFLSVSASHDNGAVGEREAVFIDNNYLSNNDGYSEISFYIENNDITFGFYEEHPQLVLNGETFSQVLESVKFTDEHRYSKVYYTSEEGIVGFMDAENVLWSLVRYDQ